IDRDGPASKWAPKGNGGGNSASIEANPRLSATGSPSAGPSGLRWSIKDGTTHSVRKTPKGPKKSKAQLKSTIDAAHKKNHTAHSKREDES
ncbi:hypothetical protein Ancab_010510, partial [Ancistrocladus abbreviatus]